MSGSKCDSDGNLYIRKLAMDRPLLGPVVKIDPGGKRVARFDPAAFSELGLERADAFSPAPDGGLYQIAQSGGVRPRIYVLHFSSDGSPSSRVLLEADFEVYTFAAFAEGNFLVSGMRRDVLNKGDRGRSFSAIFSADGRELAQLSFPAPSLPASSSSRKGGRQKPRDGAEPLPSLDLALAEAGSDGNVYVLGGSAPARVYVIAPSGEILRKLKIGIVLGTRASGLRVSGNRVVLSFDDNHDQNRMLIVAETQTGREIARYADSDDSGSDNLSSDDGSALACYSANEGAFTFLRLGEGNAMEVIRAEAQ